MTLEEAKAKYPSRFGAKNADYRYQLFIVSNDDKITDNTDFACWNMDRWYDFAHTHGCKNCDELFKKLGNATELQYSNWLFEFVHKPKGETK